jgi:hypothetical protein
MGKCDELCKRASFCSFLDKNANDLANCDSFESISSKEGFECKVKDRKSLWSGPNAKYNAGICLCYEDIMELKNCLDKVLDAHICEPWVDLFPFVLQDIIKEWEEKIGKTIIEIQEEMGHE